MDIKKSRSQNAALNTVWAIVTQIFIVFLSFFSRKVFLSFLGAELLGVNSLFSDVLTLFSFADLGLGTAIAFSMYKPIAENNENRISSLLLFYKTIYRYVIAILIIISLCFIPFLAYIKTDISINELLIYYVLYQINCIIEYIWVYRESYVIAIQRERELSRWNLLYNTILRISQIIIVVLFHNFIMYLIIGILCNLAKKLVVNSYITNKYPITKLYNAQQLSKDERRLILKKAYALLITRIGNLVINQTDSLIVSYLISVVEWGFASNYLVIKKSIYTISDKIYSAVLPSMGNLLVEDNKRHQTEVFMKYDFFNAWMYTFFFVSFLCLSNPFIALFFGSEAVLPDSFVFVFFFAAFVDGLRSPVSVMREAGGTFEQDKWYTIVAAVVNIVTSIPLALIVGLSGVYIGTICAMCVLHVFRSFVLLKDKKYSITFNMYILTILNHIIIGLVLSGLTHCFTVVFDMVIGNTYLLFIAKCAVVLVIPNVLWILIYWKKVNLKNACYKFIYVVKNKRGLKDE